MSSALRAFLRDSPLEEIQVNEPSRTKLPDVEKTALLLAESPHKQDQYLAYACLYRLDKDKSQIVRKHHKCISQLIVAKDYHHGLCHLDLMLHAVLEEKLPKVPHFDLPLLLRGIPSDSEVSVSVANAFHVLLFQTTLQYISSNLGQLANKDGISAHTFGLVAKCFNRESSFFCWLQRYPEDQAARHLGAFKKIVSGFLKILGFVKEKHPNLLPEASGLQETFRNCLHNLAGEPIPSPVSVVPSSPEKPELLDFGSDLDSPQTLEKVENLLLNASVPGSFPLLSSLALSATKASSPPLKMLKLVLQFLEKHCHSAEFSEFLPIIRNLFTLLCIKLSLSFRLVSCCKNHGKIFRNTDFLLMALQYAPDSASALHAECQDSAIEFMVADGDYQSAAPLLKQRLTLCLKDVVVSVFDSLSVPENLLLALVSVAKDTGASILNEIEVEETPKMLLASQVASADNTLASDISKVVSFKDTLLNAFLAYNLSSFLEISEPHVSSSPLECLLLAGARIQSLRVQVLSKGDLVFAFEKFQIWASDSSKSAPELRLFTKILQECLCQSFYLLCVDMVEQMETCKLRDDNKELLHWQEMKISCLLRLGQFYQIPLLLSELGQVMKKLASKKVAVTSSDVAAFKLLQMEYLIRSNSDPASTEKKIKSTTDYFQSRDEFSLSNSSGLTVSQTITNLLMSYRLLGLTARYQHQIGDFGNCLRNTDVAVKILTSILRKLQTTARALDVKPVVMKELFQSYFLGSSAARHLGLLVEMMGFHNETKKLNEAYDNPSISVLACFKLADEALLLGDTASFQQLYQEGSRFSEATDMLLPKLLQLKSAILFNAFTGEPTEELTDSFTMYLRSANSEYEVLLIPELIQELDDFQFLISAPLEEEFSTDRSILLKTVIKCKEDISDSCQQVSHTTNTPLVISSGFEVEKPHHNCLSILLQCKQMLLEIKKPANLRLLSVDESSHAAQNLTRCLLASSHLAVLKLDTAASLLRDAWELQDWPRKQPLANHKNHYEHKFSGNQSLLPSLGSGAQLDLSLFLRLDKLPQSWAIFTVDVCVESQDLILSKYLPGCSSPIFLKLPIGRNKQITWDSLTEELNSIVSESNATTKKELIAEVKTKEDRRIWWKKRFSLDVRLQELLSMIDQSIIGGFRGIFEATPSDSEFTQFKSKLQQIWAAASGIPELNLSENIAALFYNLNHLEHLEDLVSYTAGELCVSKRGKDKATKDTRALLSATQNARTKHEHIVLIPSHRCAGLPWESIPILKNQSISRMPSASKLADLYEQAAPEINTAFYVLNPGTDLKRTEGKFGAVFEENGFNGVSGTRPAESYLVDELFNHPLFLYLGHGGGEQYMRLSKIMKKKVESGKTLPPALLFGCSSGAITEHGRLEPTGNVFNWLAGGSPCVVSNLWDVTDKDIDIFSMGVFEQTGILGSQGDSNICQAVLENREKCILKHLNGAAPVVHGLPLRLQITK